MGLLLKSFLLLLSGDLESPRSRDLLLRLLLSGDLLRLSTESLRLGDGLSFSGEFLALVSPSPKPFLRIGLCPSSPLLLTGLSFS